jgi:tripartite-type tricarboxylate transporter receptor subunit TctC
MRSTQSLLAGMLLTSAALVHAAYPDHPIRVIVPYAPGGNIDITARTITPGLSEVMGVQFVVDNRAGAGGTIGSDLAAKAAPDGYTTLLGSTGTLATAPLLYKISFDPLKDFAYTSLVSVVPLVCEVNPHVPAKTVKELIALAKARPGRITMGSAGTGTSNHLSGELFQSMAGIKVVHVPYKGSGPALVDLMGGQVDMMFDQLSSSYGYIKAGKLRALAVTTLKRSSVMPDIPTMDESGLKGYESSTSTGILLPAATPKDIVDKMHDALIKVLTRPATKEAFARFGADVLHSSPAEFEQLMRTETAKWQRVVREAHIETH